MATNNGRIRDVVVLCTDERIAERVMAECRKREIEPTWISDERWTPERDKFYIYFVSHTESAIWETWLLRHFHGSSILNWF